MQQTASTSSPDGRNPAILIVDDAPANLAMLRKMLVLQGYQTFVANSGERALKIAHRAHPDLILLDVVMPGMDGLETCRRLKQSADTARIPVIFMSAHNETEDVVAGLDHGAVDYIGKPLRMAEVCARVRTQLQIHGDSASRDAQAVRLRAILDGMAEGLMIIEVSGRIQYANPACHRTLGYAVGELAGSTMAALLGQDSPDLRSAPGQRQAAREVMVTHRDGSVRAMELTLTPLAGREVLHIGLLHDITRHKQLETALQRAALADPLTMLANRRHFDSFIELEWQRAIRSSAPMSVVALDVDHFKLYNDALGHAAGDAALRAVADVLAAHALRPTDLAARYGGEEFVLLFAETPAAGAALQAESIRARIEALQLPHPQSSTGPWLTASIGVATTVPTQLDDIGSFLVAADRAMYAAKEGGRNRVVAVDAGNSSWEAVKALVMR